MRGWGLNNRGNNALVQGAYEAIVPVVNSVMRERAPNPVPANQLQALEGWLEDHLPANWKVTPSSKELPQSEQEGQPMAGGDAATNNAGAAPLAGVSRP
jgi:hypothetical protein